MFSVILNNNTNNVILNAVKNLSVRVDGGAIVDDCAIPEILRFTQDDRGMGSMSSGVFFVILNAVKNLSERGGGRTIVDGSAIPEILRSAQDDRGIAKRLASSRIEVEQSAEIQKKYPATSVAG